MPKQLKWKKMMSGILALSLATGGGAVYLSAPVAVFAESALKTPFTDMTAGHWAEKHIAKLYLQGVIDGYRNSVDNTLTFQPEKSITQQEAVLMALKFSGLKDEAEARFSSSMVFFQDGFEVSSFFMPYIEYAFTEGLLDRTEEYNLASADKEQTWGSKPASREWVTKLIVKAIGQNAIAQQLQTVPSHFADGSSISQRYLGYVNAAFQLKLITGKTETTFAPGDPVNRASLATLFSRAQYNFPVQYAGQENGVISDLQDGLIKLYDNGTETSYFVDGNTLFYHYNSDKPITVSELVEYSDITVIARDGVAKYVEVLGDVQHTENISGTFLRNVPEDQAFYLWIDKEPVKFAYDASTPLVDTDGKVLNIADIKEGRAITLVRDTFRTEPKIIKLVADAQVPVTKVTGVFTDVKSNLIRINENNNYVTKELVLGATVEINGLTAPSITDLIEGSDQVELSLNDQDKVTHVKVLNRDVKLLAGAEIWEVNEAKNLIAVTDSNGKSQLLTLTDKTKFDYMGTTLDRAAAIAMLQTNKNVVISYTHDSVVHIKFVLNYTGTLTTIDTKNKKLTLQTADGAIATLPYTSTVVSDVNKPLAAHGDLKTGDTLTVLLKQDKVEVTAIQVHRTNQYEVVSIDVAKRIIKAKNLLNETFDINVNNAELLKADGTKEVIGLFTAGTKIDVSYVGTNVSKVKIVASGASNG
ncbi:S-layer homology domain-containing protein [Paenibacillus sp. CAU 1782]